MIRFDGNNHDRNKMMELLIGIANAVDGKGMGGNGDGVLLNTNKEKEQFNIWTKELINVDELSQDVVDEFVKNTETENMLCEKPDINYPAQVNEEVMEFTAKLKEIDANHNFENRYNSGKIIFGDKFEKFEDWRSSWLYVLKDGTEYAVSMFGTTEIMRPDGQRECYSSKNGKLLQFAHRISDNEYERLTDTDGDGYVDIREIGRYEKEEKGLINNHFRSRSSNRENLPDINTVSEQEAEQRIITNFLIKE